MKFLNRLLLLKKVYDLKHILASETIENKKMFIIYHKMMQNNATQEEIAQANKQFQELLKTIGFGVVFTLPIGSITLPIMVKITKKIGINILPEWVSKMNKNE